MKKRIGIIIFCLTLMATQPLTLLACEEEQSDTYVTQILFGNDAGKYENNTDVKILLNALYLCSIQSDNQGQSKLEYLKTNNVSGVPKLSTININSDDLLDCSHVAWDTEFLNKKIQNSRRKLLRNATEKVFDFGVMEELFDSKDGKSEAFIKLLYYSHILADYIADSPSDTEATLKNGTITSYAGSPYIEVNGNKPVFSTKEKTEIQTFEYSNLDQYGRTGQAIGWIGPETIGTNEGNSIQNITPSGWSQQSYSDFVNTKELYNRSHLIGRALGGHDTRYNLVTGTRYMNYEGMEPFERKVTNYIKATNNHVVYRVTPIYKGTNQMASGVQMEAYSIEDKGKGLSFNIYCYNVQPGVYIDYTNGENDRADNITGSSSVLEFASADYKSNPDLIELMNGTLEQLFSESVKSQTYTSMMLQLDAIANDARNIDYSSANGYVKLKTQEYKYLEVLKENVPELLKKEEFFKSAF